MNAEEIVRTYSDMIYKIAFRYVWNPYDAEDVLAETFLTYFKRERSFESEEHRKAWLIKVACNEAKDILSGRGGCEKINEEIAGADEQKDLEDVMDLRAAINRLPDHQREVIILHYLHDIPIAEIAGILDKNKNTVAVTLMRARENLKTYLEQGL